MAFLAPIAAGLGALFGTTLGAAIGKLAIGIGLNLIVSKIQARKARKAQRENGGVEFDRQYGENVGRHVACGLVSVAGHDVYVNTYSEANKFLQQIYVLSDYPCDGLSRIWAGGKELALTTSDNKNYTVSSGDYAGRMSFRFYDGRQASADADLIAKSNPLGRWTSAHVGHGMCYLVAFLTYDQEKLNQFPDFQIEFRGARLYDWRKDSSVGGSGNHRWGDYATHEFSRNPIVMDYNYRRGFSWAGDLFCGMDMVAGDLPIDRYSAAANICDEAASYGPRFTCSMLLKATAQHGENIDQLMMSCGGIVIDGVEGSWPLVGSSQPIVETFTDDDLVRDEPVRFQAKRSMADLVNSVSGTYPEPANLWASTGYDTQSDAAYVAIDRRTRDMPLDFPMVPNKGQANQLASIYYKENRYEKSADIVLRPRFRTLEAGDWVYWDSADEVRRGTYIVQSRSIKALTSDGPRNVSLALQERSGAIYDSVGVTAPLVSIPNSQPIYLNELQDYTVASVLGISPDTGRAYSSFRVSWAAITDPTVSGIDFQWWMTAEPTKRFSTSIAADVPVLMLQEGVVSLTEYSIRYRLRSSSRATSWIGPLERYSLDGGENNLQVGLSNLQKDATDQLKELADNIERLWGRVGELADIVPIAGAIGERNRRRMQTELNNSRAAIIEDQKALVNAEAAFAQSLLQVNAEIDETNAMIIEDRQALATLDGALATTTNALRAEVERVSADGHLSITATTIGSVLSEIKIAAKAQKTDAEAALAAIILRVINESGVLKSQILLNANRTVFTNDSGSVTHQPFVIENGVLKGNIAEFGTINAMMLESTNGGFQGNIADGALEWQDV